MTIAKFIEEILPETKDCQKKLNGKIFIFPEKSLRKMCCHLILKTMNEMGKKEETVTDQNFH